jgi:alpha-ribazole phosphatase
MATGMVFIRHGDTGNPWGVFVGSTDADLVEGALEKARELGERLRPEGIRAIYTSRLQRAWKTADAIGEVLGVRPVRMKELNEVDFGKWEMKWKGDVEEESPGILDKRKVDIWNYAGHGGESYAQARDRAMPVIRKLFRKHEGETFAVVAHGSLMKIVYSTLMGIPVEGIFRNMYEPLYTIFFKRHGDRIEVEKSWGASDG